MYNMHTFISECKEQITVKVMQREDILMVQKKHSNLDQLEIPFQ